MKPRIELKLPSQMAYLGVPDAVLLEVGSDLDCPRHLIEELGTAVIEACTNAMEHGNGLDPARPIEIHIEVGEDRIAVEVLDDLTFGTELTPVLARAYPACRRLVIAGVRELLATTVGPAA